MQYQVQIGTRSSFVSNWNLLLHILKGFLFTPGSNRVVYVLESVWKGFALDWELFSLLKWNCSSACIEERSTPISLMHKRPPLKTPMCGRFYEITFHTRDLKTVFSVTDFLSEKRRMNIGSCRQQPYFRRHCTEIVHCSTITNLESSSSPYYISTIVTATENMWIFCYYCFWWRFRDRHSHPWWENSILVSLESFHSSFNSTSMNVELPRGGGMGYVIAATHVQNHHPLQMLTRHQHHHWDCCPNGTDNRQCLKVHNIKYY